MRALILAAVLVLASCQPQDASLRGRVSRLEAQAAAHQKTIRVLQESVITLQEHELARLKSEPIELLAMCNSGAALYRNQCLDVAVGNEITGASVSVKRIDD